MKKNTKDNRIILSIIFNYLIFLLVLIASIMMFTGFKFMPDIGPNLETTRIGMFKFFTIDSNVFMGIVAVIYATMKLKTLKDNKKELNPLINKIKLMATTSVFLTFFVVFVYLGPISKGGVKTLLVNSNLFLHLIVPVLSIITFVFIEKDNNLKFKDTFLGLIPTIVYGIFYVTNVLIHTESGKVSTLYDWYWFVQNGVWTAFIVVPIIFLMTYGLGFLLWKLNKRL